MKKKLLLSAFILSITCAIATQISAHSFVNNRRDSSCTAIMGDCTATGSADCATVQYNLSDTNCQTKLEKRP